MIYITTRWEKNSAKLAESCCAKTIQVSKIANMMLINPAQIKLECRIKLNQ